MIRKATVADMAEVKGWLQQESEMDSPGCFFCNWDTIENGQEEGRVYILPDVVTGLPIGFFLDSSLRPDIVAVKADRRGEGHGRTLATFMIDIWRKKDDVCVIEIECAPWASVSFWRHMGFTIYADHHAYMLLPKAHDLPANVTETTVMIAFYPEHSLWSRAEPLMVAAPRAVRKIADILSLAERVFFFEAIHSGANRDIVVTITVDDVEICRDKAKSTIARNFGVRRDRFGWFIDQIQLPPLPI